MPDQPCLSAFQTLMTGIVNVNNSPPTQLCFSSQCILALHRDPDDLSKLCPVGIGVALHHLSAAVLTTVFSSQFADCLTLTGQHGVAFEGGLNFVLHSTQAQLKFLMHSPKNTSLVLLLLNIVNVFDATSCDTCHSVTAQNPAFAPLLPFFDFLHGEPDIC